MQAVADVHDTPAKTPPGAPAWMVDGGAWIHIAPSGAVTAFSGKVDVGQDNSTAFRLLVAETVADGEPADRREADIDGGRARVRWWRGTSAGCCAHRSVFDEP